MLVLLDADDDCPAELGPELLRRAAEATQLPVRVVLPKIEIEAWVLSRIESVRGVRGISRGAKTPADPESIRNAKAALSDRMDGTRGYVPLLTCPHSWHGSIWSWRSSDRPRCRSCSGTSLPCVVESSGRRPPVGARKQTF